MEPSEKIVNVYLRLNGFFIIPKFSVLVERATHVDILGMRIGNSEERVGKNVNSIPLRIDDDFLKLLGISKNDDVGLVVEVKGGEEEHGEIPEKNFVYVIPFFGRIDPFRVVFEKAAEKLEKKVNNGAVHFVIPLSHCLNFINQRFEEMEEIEHQIREHGDITKYGSWYLSEEFLSELIYLKSLGFFGNNQKS